MGNPQPQQQQQLQQQQDEQLQGPPTAVLSQGDQPHRLQTPRSNPVGPPRGVSPSQVEALGGPPAGHPPQCQLNAGALALFAPSIRTPPPRRHSANLKGDWTGPPPSELSRHTPSTSSRTRHAGDRRTKGPTPTSEELNQLMDTANQSLHPSAGRKNTRGAQAEASRPQQQQCEHNQLQMQQQEEQLMGHPHTDNTGTVVEGEASENPNTSTPSIVVSPPESSVGTRAPSLSQLQDHGSSPAVAAEQLQQLPNTIIGAAIAAAPHSSGAFTDVQGDLHNRLPGLPEEKRHGQQQQQKGPRGPSGRSRRGRKRRECGARREPSGQLPSIGEPLGPADSLRQAASTSQAVGADERWGGLSYCGIPLKPLRAAHILELSPLLLAKVLQLLPVGSAAAFGSTCWRARRVLLSYSCIVSLSARNVSSLLSLPPAALKRQLPFLSGLKSLEIELTSAVSPPLFLGAAAAAAAAAAVAAAGNLLRPTDAGYEQAGNNSNTWSEQVQTPRGTRGERRQQQQRTASNSRQQQADQQEGGQEGQGDATGGRVAAVPSLSRLSWAYGLVQGRALEFLRVQPTLSGPTAAAGEAPLPATTPPSPASPWTTYTAANASPLLNSLCHLKSLSAKLKLSPTGTHGDAQASTELLLLLQMLLHRNAHSLVSIKIAVDLSASSVTSNLSISLGFSTLSIHSAQRLMLMKAGILWREPTSPDGFTCPCFPRRHQFGDTDPGGYSVADCIHCTASKESCCALLEVEDEALEQLKEQLGKPAPAAQASVVGGGCEASAATSSGDLHCVQPRVVAFLPLTDSSMATLHCDGSLCIIRRKEKPATGPSRIFCGSGGPLPLTGQAVALLRRRAILLSELSAVAGNPFLYRMNSSTANPSPGDSSPGMSLAPLNFTSSEQPQLQQQQQQQSQSQQQQRSSESLPSTAPARGARPTQNTSGQEQNPQRERATQELLVLALQHLLEVGAESLQLLDVDGEVRHFSVLHEQLNFKCLRRLSLGWTITPELQQLLFLFSSKKLRSLQKLNFNGPAQIHPEAYIHINRSTSPTASNGCGSWGEPCAAPLDEATLRRSAGLNNYGLGQIHLQLYALLNCGACSVSQIDYARQQLLQQQLQMLASYKKSRSILRDIKSLSDPLCLEVEYEAPTAPAEGPNEEETSKDRTQELKKESCLRSNTSSEASGKERLGAPQQPVDTCSSVAVEFNRMLLQEDASALNKSETTSGSSCRHRVQQAGSWLWRAIPSSLRGLAGSRGCINEAAPPLLEPQLEAADAIQSGGGAEGQRSAHLEQQGNNGPVPVAQTSPPECPPHDSVAVATQHQDDSGLPARRRRPSEGVEGNRHSSDTEITAAIVPSGGPRPKRRRLVEAPLGWPAGEAQTRAESLRRHLAAFARGHLPLLGDLICPHLEALGSPSRASRRGRDEMLVPLECVSKEKPETQLSLKRVELQVLKGVTSFLLDTAGEILAPMLEGPKSSSGASNKDSSNDSSEESSSDGCQGNNVSFEQILSRPSLLPGRSCNQACRNSSAGSVVAAHATHPLQPLLRELQRQQEEDDELSLLRLLQHSPSPRTSWSHGVFFKYAYVDLDFECLATFRICLCHHPLFIFYKEHEKGLHVLHVDGVFNAGADSAQEKTELWRERLSYNYVCDPSIPFDQQPQRIQQQQQQQQQSQQDRHTQPPQESLETAETAGASRPTSSRSSRRSGNSSDVRDAPTERTGNRSERSARIQLPAGSMTGCRHPLLATPPTPREGDIRLCSAKASICRTVLSPKAVEQETPSTLLPHVGPQMTGYDLFCLEMWSVLSLCRDQVCPPSLTQYLAALRRLWAETLTQQQRDIYNNIITPKYIARRLKAPDLTFEALPPWWQQQQQQTQSRRRPKGAGGASPSMEGHPSTSSPEGH